MPEKLSDPLALFWSVILGRQIDRDSYSRIQLGDNGTRIGIDLMIWRIVYNPLLQ